MTWDAPTFSDINMNAEIGSYQEDDRDDGNTPVVERIEVDGNA
jgi:hypothetical protein